MKKIMSFVLIWVVIFMSGCSYQKNDYIKILVPNGVPSIAQVAFEFHSKDANNYRVDRVYGVQNLIASFISESHHIIIAPLNLGVNMYNKGANYQLASMITHNNLQLVSSYPIESLAMLQGASIISFGEHAIPQMILETLLQKISYDNSPSINYLSSSSQENITRFLNDPTQVYLSSEPYTTLAQYSRENTYVYDLSLDWAQLVSEEPFPQAGVFVHVDLDDEVVNEYLNALESSINDILDNPILAGDMASNLDYPFDSSIIALSIPKSHIYYQKALKDEIEAFLFLIELFNPDLIGGKIPNDSFYWWTS